MLASLERIALRLDELGYWGCPTPSTIPLRGTRAVARRGCTTSTWGRRTTRLSHGQLGFVLPTHDPIGSPSGAR